METEEIRYTLDFGQQTYSARCFIPVGTPPEEIEKLILFDAFLNDAIEIEYKKESETKL